MAWDILDGYKKAVLLTDELEVEIEATAISRIGSLYDKVFKLKSKARESFKAAIALALSMHPRTFSNDGETYFELHSFFIRLSFVSYLPKKSLLGLVFMRNFLTPLYIHEFRYVC